MPRSYRHIKDYEKEILELKAQGLSKNEIGKQLGFTFEQIQSEQTEGCSRNSFETQRQTIKGLCCQRPRQGC